MHKHVSRRTFLRAAGVSLALPWLEAMAPAARAAEADSRKRLVCVSASLGYHAPFFFPEKAGGDYTLSPYLEPFAELRKDFTVFSGLMHPSVNSGHPSERSSLSGAPDGSKTTISMDQVAAEKMVGVTRFNSLVLGNLNSGGISFTRTGVALPKEIKPSAIFAKLFLGGSASQVQDQVHRLRDGRSIMDAIMEPTKRMARTLGKQDQDRLDEYFNSVRDVEKQLLDAEEWTKKPKPTVTEKAPKDVANSADLIGQLRSMYDLAFLALRTDSTRVISMCVFGGTSVPLVEGVSRGHHECSHHGQSPEKIAQLRLIEGAELLALRDFLARLKSTKEEGVSLLDQTAVLSTSNLGNASNHTCKNLPVLVAGGGFKHGIHLAYNPDTHPPLCNLYTQILRQVGVNVERFGTSTNTSLPGFTS
ncbi:MAG: DUF1552 domain-containing protein [Planctomycetota bacterium]